jgi:hypothetical protein
LNPALTQLAREIGLDQPAQRALRLAFGLACAQRVRHLIEQPRALACLDVLAEHVASRADAPALEEAAREIAALANAHRGSNSMDGSAHAAVSATYGAANALAGRALEAAGYAAYATVYAYGGYAVSDPSSFETEFAWQVQELGRLAAARAGGAAAV